MAVQGQNDDGSDATIANQHGTNWVEVPGMGRISYVALKNFVDSGRIVEEFDENKNAYSYFAK